MTSCCLNRDGIVAGWRQSASEVLSNRPATTISAAASARDPRYACCTVHPADSGNQLGDSKKVAALRPAARVSAAGALLTQLHGGSVTPTPTPTPRQPGLARRLLLRLIGADTVAPAVRALGRGLLSIFTLHRFTDPEHEVEGTDPATLRDHLAYLRRHNYRLLSLTAALRLLEDGDAGWRTPAVAFTVDDGYADFAAIAAPIFAEFDCPVTLFVTTGFLDGQLWLWWDRVAHVFQQTRQTSVLLRVGPEVLSYRWSTPSERVGAQQDVIERLQMVGVSEREAVITSLTHQLDVELPARPPSSFAPISWDDVRRTARLGATFGPHTVTHPILALTNDATCNWEIQESYRRVRQETDASVPVSRRRSPRCPVMWICTASRRGKHSAGSRCPASRTPAIGVTWLTWSQAWRASARRCGTAHTRDRRKSCRCRTPVRSRPETRPHVERI